MSTGRSLTYQILGIDPPWSVWALTRVLVFVGTISLAVGATYATAQGPEEWTPPVWLSESVLNPSGYPVSSISVALVSDPWNQVHAFWISIIEDSESAFGSAIYYSRWDGVSWTEPVDIFYGGGYWSYPQAAIDSKGRLYLTWIDGAQVWYSRAPVSDSDSARAWQKANTITADTASSVAVAIGANDTLYVVYCSRGEPGHLAYVFSEDGETWSFPVYLAGVSGCWARIAVDTRERLHVAFTDQAGLGAGSAAFYVGSDDGGHTWSQIRELDRKDEHFIGDYGPSWASVIAVNDDEVHILWDGAPAGQRWHQWSLDGGETWIGPRQLWGNFRGLTGPNALAVDSAGNLHMVSMGWIDPDSSPAGAFHALWHGGEWSPPQLIGTRTDWDAEGPALVVAGGNELVAGWWNRTGDATMAPVQIWASTLHTGTPELIPLPTSPQTSASKDDADQATRQAQIAPTAEVKTATGTAPSGIASPVSSFISLRDTVLIGILPALLIIGAVFFQHLRHRRH